jgi:predicted TIM-barrel fold metal-dependent hydrolase
MTPGAPGAMQDENWLRGFALLEKYQLSWDLRVPFWHLEEAAAVARAFPRTPIILNHTGFPWDRSEEGLAAWRRGMEVLAREPNVCVKVSEFGLRDRAWDYDENRRVVLDAIAIFGIERSVFATNFPVASLRIGYGPLVDAMNRMLAGFSAEDRDRFFWKNAAGFYRLKL